MIYSIYPGSRISFKYTNYKGETSIRTITYQALEYGSNEYHKEQQWFVYGICSDKQAPRSFALKDIEISSINVL